MKTGFGHIALSVLMLAASASCGKFERDMQTEIRFRAVGTAPAETRAGAGGIKTTTDNLKSGPFGIYGVHSATAGGGGTNVFDGTAAISVSYVTDGSGGSWEYSRSGTEPYYYWKRNQHYRFRAYHPYSAAVQASSSDADRIRIDYSIGTDDYDLLVAFATRHPATEGYGKVTMNFRHALAALRFRIIFRDTVTPQSHTDAVTDFHLKGLKPAGTLQYSHSAADPLEEHLSWDAFHFNSLDEWFRWTGRKEFGVSGYTPPGGAELSPTDIFDNDNIVFVVPQTCSDPFLGKTSVHFRTELGGSASYSVELPELEWKAGKIHTYTLTIDRSTAEVEVSIKDWNSVESTVNIYF